MLIKPLNLTTPIAAFNGGLIVNDELATLRALTIADASVAPIIDILNQHKLSVWVFQGTEWYVLDPSGPHVEHEAWVCQFDPITVTNFDAYQSQVSKIVGVSADPGAMASATKAVTDTFSNEVSATSSQSYYLDITHRDANKGNVVDYLAQIYGIDASEIATIGDMANDVLMFAKSGLAIAMGQSSDEIKSQATHVTTSLDDEGFARAVHDFFLSPSC